MVRQRDIHEGRVYAGRDGEQRQVETIECSLATDYRVRVTWVENAARWGNCSLKTFAAWAKAEAQ